MLRTYFNRLLVMSIMVAVTTGCFGASDHDATILDLPDVEKIIINDTKTMAILKEINLKGQEVFGSDDLYSLEGEALDEYHKKWYEFETWQNETFGDFMSERRKIEDPEIINEFVGIFQDLEVNIGEFDMESELIHDIEFGFILEGEDIGHTDLHYISVLSSKQFVIPVFSDDGQDGMRLSAALTNEQYRFLSELANE